MTAPLTRRQADVERCRVQGMSIKQTARELGMGPGTVKAHTTAILRKRGVRRFRQMRARIEEQQLPMLLQRQAF